MMKWIRLVFVASLLALGGCVTPLQPDNYADKFTVTQLADDQFQVDYSSWGTDDDQSVADFALLRSAEITLNNGYHYFALVNGDSAADPAVAEPPSPDVEYLMHNGLRYQLAPPGDANHVICLRENPAASGFVALFVKASLGAKYRLDQVGVAN